MQIKEIHFNHGPENGSIPLCHGPGPGLDDLPIAITAPEWRDGISRPAAYARGAVKGPITIKVKFIKGPRDTRLEIRGVGSLEPRLRSAGMGATTTVLGEVKPRVVAFDANGESGLEKFQLSGRLEGAPVDRLKVEWNWQASNVGVNNWRDFVKTYHYVYVTLEMPTKPWLDAAAEVPSLAWIEVFDIACAWAGGATTLEDIVRRVATEINTHPHLEYDEAGKTFTQDNRFHLYAFLNQLRGVTTNRIDCTGIASALVTFVAVLGVELKNLQIKSTVPGVGIPTRKIRALRDGWHEQPTWKWHEVAVHPASPVLDNSGGVLPGATMVDDTPLFGITGRDLIVYDANVRLRETNELFPIGLRLGTAHSGDGKYRDLLVKTGDAAKATPQAARQPT